METVTTAETEASDQTAVGQTPVRIAILDSGISTAAIDPESLEGGLNRIKPLSDTEDTIGHGTAVASIIMGFSLLSASEFLQTEKWRCAKQ